MQNKVSRIIIDTNLKTIFYFRYQLMEMQTSY